MKYLEDAALLDLAHLLQEVVIGTSPPPAPPPPPRIVRQSHDGRVPKVNVTVGVNPNVQHDGFAGARCPCSTPVFGSADTPLAPTGQR